MPTMFSIFKIELYLVGVVGADGLWFLAVFGLVYWFLAAKMMV